MKKLLTHGNEYTFDLFKVLEPIYNHKGIDEVKINPSEEKVIMGYKENAALSGGSSMPLDDFIMMCLKWAQDRRIPMNLFDKDPSIFGILQVCWNWQSSFKKADTDPKEAVKVIGEEAEEDEEVTAGAFELALADEKVLYTFDLEAVMTAIMGSAIDKAGVDIKSACISITYKDDGKETTAYLPYVDVAQHAFKWALQNKIDQNLFNTDPTLFGVLEVCFDAITPHNTVTSTVVTSTTV